MLGFLFAERTPSVVAPVAYDCPLPHLTLQFGSKHRSSRALSRGEKVTWAANLCNANYRPSGGMWVDKSYPDLRLDATVVPDRAMRRFVPVSTFESLFSRRALLPFACRLCDTRTAQHAKPKTNAMSVTLPPHDFRRERRPARDRRRQLQQLRSA